MRPFVNWAGTVRAMPHRWVRPASEGEVAHAVREAGRQGRRVKAVGSGHSWSPCAVTNGVAIDLSDLDRVLELGADSITVEAGCSLHALLDVLHRHGRALSIVGSIDAQRMGGLIATGTHGSSLRHGNLASFVRAMTVVDGRGEAVPLTGDELVGGRVHLGALGVVTQLTIQTEPAFYLREDVDVVPFDAGIDELEQWARASEYVKVWWFPHTDSLIRFRYSRTDDRAERNAWAWRADSAVSALVFPALLALGGTAPALIPWVNRAVAAFKFRPSTRVCRSDHALVVPDPPRHRETEMAFPIGYASTALRWLRDWLVRHHARADFIQEVRFVPADAAWMSPSFGRDTCQLGVYAARSPHIDALFLAFREAASDWGGRPHWGKELSTSPEAVDALYPRSRDFRALAQSMDPDGVFRNGFLDAILGPPEP